MKLLCDPIVRVGSYPSPTLSGFVLCPKWGRGQGHPAPGPALLRDRMLGKYLVTLQEGGEKGGRGWPTPGFPVLLQPFFLSLLFSFFWRRNPPPRRVTQTLAIRLLPGWGKQAAARPSKGVGRFLASLAGLGWPQETCLAASLPPARGPHPLPDV